MSIFDNREIKNVKNYINETIGKRHLNEDFVRHLHENALTEQDGKQIKDLINAEAENGKISVSQVDGLINYLIKKIYDERLQRRDRILTHLIKKDDYKDIFYYYLDLIKKEDEIGLINFLDKIINEFYLFMGIMESIYYRFYNKKNIEYGDVNAEKYPNSYSGMVNVLSKEALQVILKNHNSLFKPLAEIYLKPFNPIFISTVDQDYQQIIGDKAVCNMTGADTYLKELIKHDRTAFILDFMDRMFKYDVDSHMQLTEYDFDVFYEIVDEELVNKKKLEDYHPENIRFCEFFTRYMIPFSFGFNEAKNKPLFIAFEQLSSQLNDSVIDLFINWISPELNARCALSIISLSNLDDDKITRKFKEILPYLIMNKEKYLKNYELDYYYEIVSDNKKSQIEFLYLEVIGSIFDHLIKNCNFNELTGFVEFLMDKNMYRLIARRELTAHQRDLILKDELSGLDDFFFKDASPIDIAKKRENKYLKLILSILTNWKHDSEDIYEDHKITYFEKELPKLGLMDYINQFIDKNQHKLNRVLIYTPGKTYFYQENPFQPFLKLKYILKKKSLDIPIHILVLLVLNKFKKQNKQIFKRSLAKINKLENYSDYIDAYIKLYKNEYKANIYDLKLLLIKEGFTITEDKLLNDLKSKLTEQKISEYETDLFETSQDTLSVKYIDALTEESFKKSIELLFTKMGYLVEKNTNDDYEFLIRKLDSKIIIKTTRNPENINSAILHKIKDLLKTNDASDVMIVSTKNFPGKIKEIAKTYQILLISGEDLNIYLNNYPIFKKEIHD